MTVIDIVFKDLTMYSSAATIISSFLSDYESVHVSNANLVSSHLKSGHMLGPFTLIELLEPRALPIISFMIVFV